MTLSLILSVSTVVVLFESTLRLLKPLRKSRRILLLANGVGWALMMPFMFVLHMVELECEGTERECKLEKFLFFGLIFNAKFIATGCQEKSWPAVAVLSVSVVVTVYFFGALGFSVMMSSLDIDTDGMYIGDEGVVVKREDVVGEGSAMDQSLDEAVAPGIEV
ncbi:hypothetical protein BWQ96_10073 [Gracilariopsis chorda]|uniref:Uncharacterized protein n=1 Tax=Gracilariopsis chorda TaxID=448386 RepID=A0A2V3IDW7_9FLOR|nr:hypothetical protein BWQ96_10073 [Gracilariopsis chorda]|eukprot:PXF40218.1 hypothetical protein BWQ96_10073 [Gracilariopsis chorda]